MNRKYIFLLIFTCVFSLLGKQGVAQNPGEYLYGMVTTHSGEQYTGFMRWGKEELFWHDIFNSEKLPNSHHEKYVKHQEESKWSNFDWNFRSIWEDKYRETSHTFACYFGDISALYLFNDQKVKLELKNGEVIMLKGGSNDIGTVINLHDFEFGNAKIAWSKIRSIAFKEAPSNLKIPYGKAIYGLVSTKRGSSVTGFVKWDMDERCADDMLDGDSNIGDQSIPFGKIKSIKKKGDGAMIVLMSGREIFLKNSNDVNSSNRGIEVFADGIGSQKIPWSDFVQLDMIECSNGINYSDFALPEAIKSEVLTFDGNHHLGLTVYDIDEAWQVEFLDGADENIEYQIPFRYIKMIRPKNKSFSLVYLKNGDDLLLGDRQDVSFNNDGLLVFKRNKKEPMYISWEQIDKIIMR